jgi:phage baseplate assembly protein W
MPTPDDSPHFRVPFKITGSSAEYVEQDGEDEVTQCVAAVVSTEVGSRIDEPGFGIIDPTFTEGSIDPNTILQQIDEWEPRASTVADLVVDGSFNHLSLVIDRRESDGTIS